MSETIENVKFKLQFLDELLDEKGRQLDALKSSAKSVEGYAIGVRELATTNDALFLQQKREALDMLSQQKLSCEDYQFVDSILTNFYLTNRNAALEAEKVLLGRQCEIAACSQEINTLSQKKTETVRTLEELKLQAAIDKRRERGVRPDQDPDTQAGRTAMDLKARKNAKK